MRQPTTPQGRLSLTMSETAVNAGETVRERQNTVAGLIDTHRAIAGQMDATRIHLD
jgi:hypothetical protein